MAWSESYIHSNSTDVLYAKKKPLSATPNWADAGSVAGVANVDYTREYVFSALEDGETYVVFIRAGASRVSTDTAVAEMYRSANETTLEAVAAKTDLIGTTSEITVTTPVIPTKWRVFAFSRVTNEPVLGDAANITAKLAIDHAGPVALADVNPVEIEDGYYYFDLSTAEQNGAVFELFPESATSGVQVIGVPGRMESNATLRAIESKTDLLGTGQATVSAPVTANGDLQPIIQGQDYTGSNSFVWTFDEYEDFVLGSTSVVFSGRVAGCGESVLAWEVAGVLADEGAGVWSVTAELADTMTALLDVSLRYDWSVQVIYNSKKRVPVKNDPKRPVAVIAKAST